MNIAVKSFYGIAAVMASLWVAAAGIGAAHADTPAPQLPGRPLDSRVKEPAAIVNVQQRLDALGIDGTFSCQGVYQANKAQAWLNFAKYAYHEGEPASVQSAALQHAGALVTALESGVPASLDTPELPTSHHVRDDLWSGVAAVKRDGRLCGAPKMTAYCEVQLAWVDFEAGAGGWRHVEPYVRIAEDYCATAAAAAPPAATPVPTSVAAAPEAPPEAKLETPAAVPAAAPALPRSSALPLDLSATVLFPHNLSRRKDMRAPGRAALERLAQQLKSLPADTAINIVGHADKTGGAHYNQALSLRRAVTVARQLTMLGVARSRLHVSAVGSQEPVVQCLAPRGPADRKRYLACLESNRDVVTSVHIDP
jgi:outer membrane protein OmpA-like peptidoglycan-associated protein